MKFELYEKPKDKEEAYKKWQIAVRVLKMLVAGEFVTQGKVIDAHNLVKDLK